MISRTDSDRRDRERRAVFLDIDGVLAPQNRENPRILDPLCVARAHNIASVATIILSSSWPMDEAQKHTGNLFDREIDKCARRSERGRPRAIAAHLLAHPEIERWVIIDDDYMADIVDRFPPDDPARALLATPERLIRTDWAVLWSPDFGGGLAVSGAGLTDVVEATALRMLIGNGPLSPDAQAYLSYVADVAEKNANSIPTELLLNVSFDAASAVRRLGLLPALSHDDVSAIRDAVERAFVGRAVSARDIVSGLRELVQCAMSEDVA